MVCNTSPTLLQETKEKDIEEQQPAAEAVQEAIKEMPDSQDIKETTLSKSKSKKKKKDDVI